jgi:hypothetical protein
MACDSVTSMMQATWLSDPLRETLAAQAVTNVSLVLRPNGQASVCVGFQSDDAGVDDSGCDSFLAVVSPSPPQFPPTIEGTQSGPISLTISNDSTLTSGSLSYAASGNNPNDFKIVDPSACTAPIPPGSSCTFQVAFTPSSGSTETAVLTVSAAPGGSVPVALEGIGVAPLRTLTVNVVNDPACVQAVASGSSVASMPPGINCTAGNTTTTTCSAPFPDGTDVVLSATPTQANFEGFAGACTSTSSPCAIVMSVDQTVTATFCGVIL